MQNDTVTPMDSLADRAAESARDTIEKTREHSRAMEQEVREATRRIRSTLDNLDESTRDVIDQTATATGRYVRERPLQAAAMLFAAGFVTAMVIRSR